MRTLLVASALVLCAGCMMGVDGPAPEESSGALSLEGSIADEGQIVWTLHNGSDEVVTVGCEHGHCWDPPLLRMEAQQSDGSWVRSDDCLSYLPERDVLREVMPGGDARLGEVYCAGPGVFRLVARASTPAGPVDAVREMVVVGWSRDHFDRGLSILSEAQEEECHVRWDIREALLAKSEPDDVLLLLERTPDAERLRVLTSMFERGSFALELADEARQMDWEALERFADRVAEWVPDYQGPVRTAIAERLMDRLAPGSEAREAEELKRLSDFVDHWPLHAPDTLVLRLETGPEEDEALGALIDTMVRAPLELFEADEPRILEALGARCRGAEGSLARSCEAAENHFDPDGFFFGGLGLGTISRCGGASVLELGVCADLDAAFQALDAEAGAVEVRFLGGSVQRVVD